MTPAEKRLVEAHDKPLQEILQDAHNAHGSIEIAAEELGVSHSTFCRLARRCGLHFPYMGRPAKVKRLEQAQGAPIEEIIDQLLKQHNTRAKVAEILGISETSVYRYQGNQSRKIERYKNKEA